jgi:GR25 family glycosyltransferase involved in LPS biosynthesis
MKRLLFKKNIPLLLQPIEDNNILINYYVIHMDTAIERKQNMINMEIKLNKKINIFRAIDGKDIKYINDYDVNCTFKTQNKNILGCYLSHYLLIKNLLDQQINENYTVIFEDDFNIIYDNLDGIIKNIINNSNFDIIFLGRINKNIITNNKVFNNIYIPSNELWGTHALLINNKSLQKIYDELKNLNTAIDIKYYELSKLNKLKVYFIYPYLVIQNNNFKSLIGYHLN